MSPSHFSFASRVSNKDNPKSKMYSDLRSCASGTEEEGLSEGGGGGVGGFYSRKSRVGVFTMIACDLVK